MENEARVPKSAVTAAVLLIIAAVIGVIVLSLQRGESVDSTEENLRTEGVAQQGEPTVEEQPVTRTSAAKDNPAVANDSAPVEVPIDAGLLPDAAWQEISPVQVDVVVTGEDTYFSLDHGTVNGDVPRVLSSTDGVDWSPVTGRLDDERLGESPGWRSFSDLGADNDGLSVFMTEFAPRTDNGGEIFHIESARWLRSTDGTFWEADPNYPKFENGLASLWSYQLAHGVIVNREHEEHPLLKPGLSDSEVTEQCHNASHKNFWELYRPGDPEAVAIDDVHNALSGASQLDDGRLVWVDAGSVAPGIRRNCADVLALPEQAPISLVVFDPDSGERHHIPVPASLELRQDHIHTEIHVRVDGSLVRLLFDNALWIVDVDSGGWEQLHRLPTGSDRARIAWSPDGDRIVIFDGGVISIGSLPDGTWDSYDTPPSWNHDANLFPRFVRDDVLFVTDVLEQTLRIDLGELD